ncbi:MULTISPECIES: hypothetical protein [unclassified Sedimentibacter]|uniref:hypothetical protein n=1 Tax=unclassified Sedimentibacter TaxID=2649220 RepID=UPI0027E07843|nr:hypothetical protein [Sedimentibacter sp. MB35-C1]WMJ78470.1 hypothetical protein RBQ61_05990 [Sedimentibacter sp. MB35-C1]
MGLSRLSKQCRECKYVDICDHKRMEALAYLEASSNGMADATAPMIQQKDYRNIKIGVDTIETIDLEEIKKKLTNSIYPNFLQYEG